MHDTRTLWDLRPGERAMVRGLGAEGDLRRRLQDIGLIQGTTVLCLGRSPLGDPAAYRIQGAIMALRRSDARKVEVWS